MGTWKTVMAVLGSCGSEIVMFSVHGGIGIYCTIGAHTLKVAKRPLLAIIVPLILTIKHQPVLSIL